MRRTGGRSSERGAHISCGGIGTVFWPIDRKSVPIPPQLGNRRSAQRTLKQFLMRAHSHQPNHWVSLMGKIKNDHIDQAIG